MQAEEPYLDLLENIEFAIVMEYRNDGAILDIHVRDAITALVRHYEAEQQSHTLGARRLSALA